MFSDHDNPVSSSATAAAQESETPQNAETTPAAETAPAAAEAAATVAPVKPEEAHAHAEAQAQTAAVDAEAAAAAEEAASAEEMSKLIDQYGEPQETASQNEIIQVKVVAYTEHGVVVDLGGNTERLLPSSQLTPTEVPAPA